MTAPPMDNHQDAGEAEQYRAYYAGLGPKLLPGQGFFQVPGLFWFMDRSVGVTSPTPPTVRASTWAVRGMMPTD